MAKIAQQQLWGNVHDIHDGAESTVDSSIFPFFLVLFLLFAFVYTQ